MYKIYLEKEKGYKLDYIKESEEEVLEILDNLILGEKYQNKILVIEREYDTDTIYYLYYGYYIPVITEYVQMREEQEREKQSVQSRSKKKRFNKNM